MNAFKKYLLRLGFFTCVALLIVALISYYYDPAQIYHASAIGSTSSSTFASRLLKSKTGLLWPNDAWSERDIKSSLAEKITNIDCAIIGSSHAMQISSFRENASLKYLCSSIVNLGVSGGTLEDYLAMSYKLISNGHPPKTIVFAVDPWALDFNRDIRWRRYKESYFSMKQMLNRNNTTQVNEVFSRWKYITNLINPSYFLRSIKQIGRKGHKIIEAPVFDYSIGIENPVFLPDGSLVYSKSYIVNAKSPALPIGGGNYKIRDGSQVSEKAVKIFGNLIKDLNDKGISTVLVMTPYHNSVWVNVNSITTKALIEVETRIRKLGRDLNVKVLGSYNPQNIGCNPDEFYDHMHAKDSCLSKIVN